MELLCSAAALDPLQEIYSTRHLGQGWYTVWFYSASLISVSVEKLSSGQSEDASQSLCLSADPSGQSEEAAAAAL